MNPAEFHRNSIIISSEDEKINFKANGSVVKFDGFLKVYETPETDDDAKNILPECKIGDDINIFKLNDDIKIITKNEDSGVNKAPFKKINFKKPRIIRFTQGPL